MAEKFSLTYYYSSLEDFERLKSFREVSGDNEKYLINQFVRGWLSRNRDYYMALAILDADARKIPLPEWAKTVVEQGTESLPEYQRKIDPSEIPQNPLAGIVLPQGGIRRSVNYITLGKQNIALLRIGILFDRDSSVGFVSRIIKEHIERNWDRIYKQQIEMDIYENWKCFEKGVVTK